MVAEASRQSKKDFFFLAIFVNLTQVTPLRQLVRGLGPSQWGSACVGLGGTGEVVKSREGREYAIPANSANTISCAGQIEQRCQCRSMPPSAFATDGLAVSRENEM